MALRKIRITPTYLKDHLDEELEAMRQEDIPRIVQEDKETPELAALVNPASLDRLLEAAERDAEASREPLREKYAGHMAKWQEERRVLLKQMERLAMDIAQDACPKCARRIRERWGGKEATLGDAWRSMTGHTGIDATPAEPEVLVSGTALEGGDRGE